MSLLSVFDIAGSALSAQSVRLNTTASNLANVDSVSSNTDRTYRARQPVFNAVFNGIGSVSSGVRVEGITESNAPLKREYRPEHPYADEEGYVSLPNVNAIEEMVNMISASRAYQNNIEVINNSKEMLLRTLSLGQ